MRRDRSPQPAQVSRLPRLTHVNILRPAALPFVRPPPAAQQMTAQVAISALATDSQRRRSRPPFRDRVARSRSVFLEALQCCFGQGSPERGSVMCNPIDIDHKHSRAISREIGERLQAYLRVEPELPAIFRTQVDQLRESEGQSPSIVPDHEHGFGNEPSKDDGGRADRSRFSWPWRRRS